MWADVVAAGGRFAWTDGNVEGVFVLDAERGRFGRKRDLGMRRLRR
jgi:hypothetical protein